MEYGSGTTESRVLFYVLNVLKQLFYVGIFYVPELGFCLQWFFV